MVCLGFAVISGAIAWQAAGGGFDLVVCAVPPALVAGVAAVVLRRQTRAIDALRTVALTLQEGVLRPLPRRVGGLRTEVRYVAADPAARVGGDIYDVVSTPFGVRMIMGDVMGKGMTAVGTAMDALGAFRELAQCEARLSMVAQRMDTALAQRSRSEDFVTALLLGLADGQGAMDLVCCGHPPPLLVRGRRATFVDALPPSPPLGLFGLQDEWCRASSVLLVAGDRLLLYTDGVTEARDPAGEFYPLAHRVMDFHDEDPVIFLDALAADLARHTKGRQMDDAALLLVDFGDIRAHQEQAHSGSPRSLRI
ncbi:PP2C family protein-serine/threonine phosphatase [Streptomyces sp. NPDC058644]|uniref:PP2C family protein-serine/threonine phosphatase n=1 Tax=unclassified Streptomyces TaxID=2593676 RepID=UPI00365BE70D